MPDINIDVEQLLLRLNYFSMMEQYLKQMQTNITQIETSLRDEVGLSDVDTQYHCEQVREHIRSFAWYVSQERDRIHQKLREPGGHPAFV